MRIKRNQPISYSVCGERLFQERISGAFVFVSMMKAQHKVCLCLCSVGGAGVGQRGAVPLLYFTLFIIYFKLVYASIPLRVGRVKICLKIRNCSAQESQSSVRGGVQQKEGRSPQGGRLAIHIKRVVKPESRGSAS